MNRIAHYFRAVPKAEAFTNLEQYLQQDHSINWAEICYEFNVPTDNGVPSARDVLTALTNKGYWNDNYVYSLYLSLYYNQCHSVNATNAVIEYQREYLQQCEFCTNIGSRVTGCKARGCLDRHISCGGEHTPWIHNRHLMATCSIEGCENRAFIQDGFSCNICRKDYPSCSVHIDRIKEAHGTFHVVMPEDIHDMSSLNLAPGHRASEIRYLRKCREERDKERVEKERVEKERDRLSAPSRIGPIHKSRDIQRKDDVDDIVKELLLMGNDNNIVMMSLGILYTGGKEITMSTMLLEISKILIDKQKKSSPKRHDSECSICLVESPQVVILECGHQCVCLNCVDSLQTCPLCRGKITRWIKVYRN